ncbi:MAG: hypothetical protein R2911_44445 [Caldilineaceae bacterium]
MLYVGQGEPMQNAIGKEVPALYDDEMYHMYIEYDVDLAHEYLAKAGMTEMGDDGFFLGPDGEPFAFTVQATDSFGFSDRAEMVTNQWRLRHQRYAVGQLIACCPHKDSNEHDVHVWGAAPARMSSRIRLSLFPANGESAFAQAWVTWYTNRTGEGALTPPEEPPAEVQHQMELYDQIKATKYPSCKIS